MEPMMMMLLNYILNLILDLVDMDQYAEMNSNSKNEMLHFRFWAHSLQLSEYFNLQL